MDCLGIFTSGNFAFKILRILETKGYVFEVVSIPCIIAKGGCGYCIKFPSEYKELIITTANENKMPIVEIYEVIPGFTRNKYKKIY